MSLQCLCCTASLGVLTLSRIMCCKFTVMRLWLLDAAFLCLCYLCLLYVLSFLAITTVIMMVQKCTKRTKGNQMKRLRRSFHFYYITFIVRPGAASWFKMLWDIIEWACSSVCTSHYAGGFERYACLRPTTGITFAAVLSVTVQHKTLTPCPVFSRCDIIRSCSVGFLVYRRESCKQEICLLSLIWNRSSSCFNMLTILFTWKNPPSVATFQNLFHLNRHVTFKLC